MTTPNRPFRLRTAGSGAGPASMSDFAFPPQSTSRAFAATSHSQQNTVDILGDLLGSGDGSASTRRTSGGLNSLLGGSTHILSGSANALSGSTSHTQHQPRRFSLAESAADFSAFSLRRPTAAGSTALALSPKLAAPSSSPPPPFSTTSSNGVGSAGGGGGYAYRRAAPFSQATAAAAAVTVPTAAAVSTNPMAFAFDGTAAAAAASSPPADARYLKGAAALARGAGAGGGSGAAAGWGDEVVISSRRVRRRTNKSDAVGAGVGGGGALPHGASPRGLDTIADVRRYFNVKVKHFLSVSASVGKEEEGPHSLTMAPSAGVNSALALTNSGAGGEFLVAVPPRLTGPAAVAATQALLFGDSMQNTQHTLLETYACQFCGFGADSGPADEKEAGGTSSHLLLLDARYHPQMGGFGGSSSGVAQGTVVCDHCPMCGMYQCV